MPTTPIPALSGPATISSANNAINFVVTGGAHAGTYTATMIASTIVGHSALLDEVCNYFLLANNGGGSFTAQGGTATWTNDANGIVTLTLAISGATAIKIAWSTSAATQGLAVLLGYLPVDQTDGTAPFTFTGTNPVNAFWTPAVAVESDTGWRPEWARVVAVTAGGQDKAIQHGTALYRRSVQWALVPAARTLAAYEGGVYSPGESLETWLGTLANAGACTYYPDATSTTGAVDAFLETKSAADAVREVERYGPKLNCYRVRLDLGKYVA